MLRKILCTGQFRPFIVVAITTGLLWLNPLLNPPSSVSFDVFPLQKCLWGGLLNNRLGAGIIALILTIILAVGYYLILRAKKFVPYRSTITPFLFIVIISHNPNLCTIHPLTLPLLCLFLSLLFALSFSPSEPNFQKSFWAGFFTGLASLFYPPAIFFLFYLWIIVLLYSSSRGRDFLLVLLGFLSPLALIFEFMFLLDYPVLEFIQSVVVFYDLPVISASISWLEWMFILLFTITILYIFFVYMSRLLQKPIQFRRTSWILAWFLFFSVISSVFSGSVFIYHLTLVILPLTAFASAYFSEPLGTWRSDMTLCLLFLIALLQNLQIIK